MSRLSQPAQKDALRTSPLISPRRSDIRISGPLPHPLPSNGPNLENAHFPTSTYTRNPQSHTSLQPPARYSPRSFAHPNDPRKPHTPHSSISSTVSRGHNTHRRRASTLRSAMKKLFGKIRHSQGDELAEDERETDPDGQSRPPWTSGSDPERSFFPMQGVPETSARSRRSRSLSMQSVPHSRRGSTNDAQGEQPKGSNMPQHDNNHLQPNQERRRHQRRSTLPSIVLSTDEARELANKIAQQAARDNHIQTTIEDQRRVGHKKRRSRSASELRRIANMHLMSPIQWRRRSEEIRYSRYNWDAVKTRQSIARPETRNTVMTTTDTNETTPLEDGVRENGDYGTPFDFGAIMGTAQDSNETSLARRVGTLEVKLMDLEFAIAKLQGHDISPFQPSGTGSQLPQKQPTDTRPKMQSAPPLQDPNLLLGSLRSTPPIVTPPRSSPAADPRPDSTATIRPQTSSQYSSNSHQNVYSPPSNPDFSGISVEQYSALTTLVRREQTARKLLEAQLVQMKTEMQSLRDGTPMSRPSSRGPSFTAPKPRTWRDGMDGNRGSTLSRSTIMTGSDQTDFDRRYSSRPRLASDGQRSQVSGMI